MADENDDERSMITDIIENVG